MVLKKNRYSVCLDAPKYKIIKILKNSAALETELISFCAVVGTFYGISRTTQKSDWISTERTRITGHSLFIRVGRLFRSTIDFKLYAHRPSKQQLPASLWIQFTRLCAHRRSSLFFLFAILSAVIVLVFFQRPLNRAQHNIYHHYDNNDPYIKIILHAFWIRFESYTRITNSNNNNDINTHNTRWSVEVWMVALSKRILFGTWYINYGAGATKQNIYKK